jgi:iron complex outermembrane receptor protein
MFISPLWAQEPVVLPATNIQASRMSQDASYTTSQASTASKSEVPI